MTFGSLVYRYDRIASTNAVAGEAAAQGAPEGAAFIADEQTSGRGLRGRNWYSPPGKGLYVSFILRPDASLHPLIPLAGGLAARQAVLESSGIRANLKWPNDILYKGAKLGGILAEAVFSGSDIQYAVLGIGLNIDHRAEDFPAELAGRALSLRMITESAPPRETVFFALCRALDDVFARLAAGEGEELVRAFQAEMTFQPGAPIRLSVPEGETEGLYQGLTARGGLIVSVKGDDRVFHSAEISAVDG
jgi:BirA family transcriptional regulator, biotin operon repressor / biotin---[acetyl-CoA-carboxylase] ligase